MVKLAGTLNRLGPANVMVVGDMLLDVYTFGKARRISPEAPVAIIHVEKEEHRAGGAGNVVLSLLSLGAKVVAVGRVGHDSAGDRLRDSLQKEGVAIDAIIRQEAYTTPVKNRIISHSQQIVRVDYEQATPMPQADEQRIIDRLPELMKGIDIVAISDYGKGFLSRTLLAALIACAKKNGIPVIADPKGTDFTKYSGVTLIKPNLSEAFAAARLTDQAPLEDVAKNIFETIDSEYLMVTRSEAGIALFHTDGTRQDFPVQAQEVKDVTGAGDTVLAMLTYAIANGLSYAEAAQLCNIAAGVAIQHVGCARVTLGDIAHRLHMTHCDNKIFDEDHLFALKRVLRERPFAVLHLSKEAGLNGEGLSEDVFKAIRQLAQKEGRNLLVSVDSCDNTLPLIHMLASLREVNYIFVNKGSKTNLFADLRPEEQR